MLDESEGFWADLISTHPPIQKRIDILLDMAHMNIAGLATRIKADTSSTAASSSPAYYAMNPQQQWQGPFTLAELGALPWLSPLSWIRMGEQQPIDRAWKDPVMNAIFLSRLNREQTAADYNCPACRQPLIVESYEGTQIYQCRFCAGILVENSKIPRILARTDRDRLCSERVKALAKKNVQDNQHRFAEQRLMNLKRSSVPLLACPKCKNPMYRGFYSAAYLIEIDRCSFCGITWFSQDELEMLQCLIESKSLGTPQTL
jgi:Zn-finger nucleic acid-binding protein